MTNSDGADLRRAERRLIVFADDWGRHPSSCQHLVRNLLNECTVSWINTIGTRSPRMTWALVRRGLEKIRQWGGGNDCAVSAAPLQVYNPAMYPGFRSLWQRDLNARLLSRFMQAQFPDLNESVVLTTIPIVADLLERVQVHRWVYYCVDDFSVWPGLDSKTLRRMERKLIAGADRIVAAGDNLAARVKGLGRDAQVISHGIDVGFWRVHEAACDQLQTLQPPVVLFWGLIDRRLDLDYLRALDGRMQRGTIALVGPEEDADPALTGLARVRRLGRCGFEQLPAMAAEAAVLVMPYADLPVTRAMQPLKLKEYLATARPVVSSRLPALTGWEDCLDIADSADEFANLVVTRCGNGLPSAQAIARRRLDAESWKAKSADLANVLFGN